MNKKILILGSSFAGYAAALELRRRFKDQHLITVIARDDRFVFLPALVWLPFGLRRAEEISFPLAPVYRHKGIQFIHAPITRIHPNRRTVEFPGGTEDYDALLIATGPKADYAAVPGLGPHEGYTQGIFSLAEAEHAAAKFQQYLYDPGPIVVGAAPGASLFTPAYEFLFALSGQLKLHGVKRKDAPLTFVTPEPYAGHLGLGDQRAAKWIAARLHNLGVKTIAGSLVQSVKSGAIKLSGGKSLPFKFAMIAPHFTGIDAVRERREFTTSEGFVRVNAFQQNEDFPEIFAAGSAVALPAAEGEGAAWAPPKTGYFAERSGRAAARNIAACLSLERMRPLAPGRIGTKLLLDAGGSGALLSKSRAGVAGWVVPGIEAHWAKLAFERYFIATRKHGAA
jgi:sulfide:quinone oxidoreductase